MFFNQVMMVSKCHIFSLIFINSTFLGLFQNTNTVSGVPTKLYMWQKWHVVMFMKTKFFSDLHLLKGDSSVKHVASNSVKNTFWLPS